MLREVSQFVMEHHLLEDGDRIAAGFSGGADSVCLLLILRELQKEYDFTFFAVHVNHGIRGAEGEEDAAFAEQFCRKKGIPFQLFRADAPAEAARKKLSLEEAARKLRYECLREACCRESAGKIALAHQADDNAETVLFNLCRGADVRGVCGIRPERDGVIRPLLCVTRRQIEEYLREKGETYRTDSSNADLRFSRNRIRARVLPELAEINPRTVEHIFRFSGAMEELCSYLSDEALEKGGEAVRFFDENGTEIETSFKEKDRAENAGACPGAEITSGIAGGESPAAAKKNRQSGTDFFKEQKSPPAAREDLPRRENLPGNLHSQPGKAVQAEIRKDRFQGLPVVLQGELLYEILVELCGGSGDIAEVHVEALRELMGAQVGKRLDLPGSLTAVSGYETVTVQSEREKDRKSRDGRKEKRPDSGACAADGCFCLPVPGTLRLPDGREVRAEVFPFSGDMNEIPVKLYTKWFDCGKIKQIISVRRRKSGDYLTVTPEGGKKKLNEYLIDEKVPRSERDRLWVLAEGSSVLWVAGYRISEAYRVTEETREILEVQFSGPEQSIQ